jgi:hypothetical protein
LILPQLPGSGNMTHPPMKQKDENTMMRMGMPVDVLPTDNDAEHLGEIDVLVKSEAFNALSPFVQGLILTHGRGHALAMQQKQAQARAAAINAGGTGAGGGMANNVPTDLGDLEGGA